MGYEKGSVVGTLTEIDGDKLSIAVEGKEYPKVIWLGKRWEGDRPTKGTVAKWNFATAPPQPGRKYGSSYLDDWEPVSNGNGVVGTAQVSFGPEKDATITAWAALKVAARNWDGKDIGPLISAARAALIAHKTLVAEILDPPKEEDWGE